MQTHDNSNLANLEIYQLAVDYGEHIWSIASRWPSMVRQTIGIQLVRSSDSISANIAESYGRFHRKDKKKFLYYARGSLYESKDWLTKAVSREMIASDQGRDLTSTLVVLSKRLNAYIRTI